MAEAGKLGGAAVPPEAGAQQAAAIAASIKQSFADSFRLVMFICAGLAWLSAVVAAAADRNKNPALADVAGGKIRCRQDKEHARFSHPFRKPPWRFSRNGRSFTGRAGVSIEGGGAFVVDGEAIAHFLFADRGRGPQSS